MNNTEATAHAAFVIRNVLAKEPGGMVHDIWMQQARGMNKVKRPAWEAAVQYMQVRRHLVIVHEDSGDLYWAPLH